MKQFKKLPFLFALIAITLSSCNMSKNVNSTASASYKKLQIAQQATVQKHNETVATTTPAATAAPAAQTATESVAVNTPAPAKHTLAHKVAHVALNSVKNNIVAFAKPGLKVANYGKAKVNSVAIHNGHSTLKGAEISLKQALITMGVGLLMIIIGYIIIAASVTTDIYGNSVNGGGFIIGALLLYIGYIVWLVGIILLIIALINR